MDLMINNINNSIIIDAIELPEFFIKKLQKNGCKVIYNHAGSPNAVIKYFGMNGVKRENLNQAKIEYLEMIDRYDYILFQSPSQAKDLYNMSSWEKDKTIVLRPSASISDIKSVKEKDSVLNTSDFNIVIVGSVQERKGQHLLPKIANSLKNEIKNIKCHIVGNIVNEEYRKTIEKDIEKLNLKDKIIFHGFKSNYLEYMNSADVILQVSEEEGVSRVLREAMALGKVIISFKLDGTNDLLVDGEDSLLSPYGNLESLANNIKKVYYDKELYDRLQETALENFKHKYSKERYLEQLENLIKRIEQDDN
jgi:glycosyltransferase involved in cell wall biosynthesis